MSTVTDENVKSKSKVGAKSKCTPELIQRAYELSAAMLLDCQIVECLGISTESFYMYKRENMQFSEALRKGFAVALEELSNNAKERARTDPIMQMFLLKNKGKHMEYQQQKNIEIKQRELEIKEKIFKLQTEKFIHELCEKNGLDKHETLEMLKKHLEE